LRLTVTTAVSRLPALVWAEIALAISSVAPILGMPIIVGALQDLIAGAAHRLALVCGRRALAECRIQFAVCTFAQPRAPVAFRVRTRVFCECGGAPCVPAVLCVIGSYWAYAERMGIEFGISTKQVHWLLTALAAQGAVLAAATYAFVHRRYRSESVPARVSFQHSE
jgi:hypothetical protein